ncbi:hypothetical protein ACFL4S_00245 [bacterium]
MCSGNATIDVTPPCKILCIKKEWHKELEKLVKKHLFKKKIKKITNRKKIKKAEEKIYQAGIRQRSYESSNIWNTRNSKYWSWIRVKEWFKEYKEKEIWQEKIIEKQLKYIGVK